LIGRPGTVTQDIIHIIDFGMAKQYTDPKSQRHVADKKAPMSGSPRFMSLRAHEGRQRSRRDDLEALGYMLLYLARPGLPWLEKSREEIAEMKKSCNIQDLCKSLPSMFTPIGNYF
jgi:casein kinase 1